MGSNAYNKLVHFLHEHCAALDHQSSIDISSNADPNYWVRQMMNKSNLLKPCKIRAWDVQNCVETA